MALLQVRDVTKRYGAGHTAVTALEGVSFEVEAGRLLAILGPSGSGKTTLLSIVAGLLRPTEGEIAVRGEPIHLRSRREATEFRRRHVGLVFQEYHLIPYLSARDNLLLLPHLAGGVTAEDRARADALLGEFGLADRAEHKPGELSGGERQRVALARAFMNRPEIMLVDEPTSNLDTARGLKVLELLRSQIHEREMTCLMVTHDGRMAEQADETLRLVDGRVAAPADPAGASTGIPDAAAAPGATDR